MAMVLIVVEICTKSAGGGRFEQWLWWRGIWFWCWWRLLLCPPMVAVGIGAHVIQLHLCFSFLGVRLKEDSLPVPALWAGSLIGPWQCGVPCDVRHNVCDLLHLVHDFVDIDTAGVCKLAIVTVPACIQQHSVVLVLLGVEHVVALLAEPDANKSRTFSGRLCHLLFQISLLRSVFKLGKL